MIFSFLKFTEETTKLLHSGKQKSSARNVTWTFEFKSFNKLYFLNKQISENSLQFCFICIGGVFTDLALTLSRILVFYKILLQFFYNLQL